MAQHTHMECLEIVFFEEEVCVMVLKSILEHMVLECDGPRNMICVFSGSGNRLKGSELV